MREAEDGSVWAEGRRLRLRLGCCWLRMGGSGTGGMGYVLLPLHCILLTAYHCLLHLTFRYVLLPVSGSDQPCRIQDLIQDLTTSKTGPLPSPYSTSMSSPHITHLSSPILNIYIIPHIKQLYHPPILNIYIISHIKQLYHPPILNSYIIYITTVGQYTSMLGLWSLFRQSVNVRVHCRSILGNRSGRDPY